MNQKIIFGVVLAVLLSTGVQWAIKQAEQDRLDRIEQKWEEEVAYYVNLQSEYPAFYSINAPDGDGITIDWRYVQEWFEGDETVVWCNLNRMQLREAVYNHTKWLIEEQAEYIANNRGPFLRLHIDEDASIIFTFYTQQKTRYVCYLDLW